jgi:hypothetical protein
MTILKVALWGVIVIVGLDLLFGATNTPVLPSWIGNLLPNQSFDAIVIGLAVLLLIFL